MRRVAPTFTAEGGRLVGLWVDGGRAVALKAEGGRFAWLSANGDWLFMISFIIWLDVLLLLRFAFGGPCWLRLWNMRCARDEERNFSVDLALAKLI